MSRNLENKEELEQERKEWLLSDTETESNIDDVFNELVITGSASPTENQTFVMVGGQAGSGKSMVDNYYMKSLNGSAVLIDQDALRLKHPRYKEIHDKYTEREEFLLLKRYIDNMVSGLINRGVNGNYNIILESALRSINKFADYIAKAKKDKKLNSILAVLATNPNESNLSMFIRYCQYLQKYGECRRNTRVDNTSVQKIPQNINKLDSMGIFDNILIYTRGNKETGFKPIEYYSKSKSPQILPSEAFIEASNIHSMTKEQFVENSSWIKETLKDFDEKDVYQKFENWENSLSERTDRECEMLH